MFKVALRVTGVIGGVGSVQGVPAVQAASPPPLIATGLVTLLGASGATATMNPNVLLLLAAIAVVLVQVMTFEAAVQVHEAEFAPVVATAPFGTVKPSGKVSVTVIVPLLATGPALLTVKV